MTVTFTKKPESPVYPKFKIVKQEPVEPVYPKFKYVEQPKEKVRVFKGWDAKGKAMFVEQDEPKAKE